MISKAMKLIFCVLAILASGNAASDGWTLPSTIGASILHETEFYFSASPPWSSTDCPTATYIWIPQTHPSAGRWLAALLAARSIGAQVAAFGSCSSDGTVVQVRGILVY